MPLHPTQPIKLPSTISDSQNLREFIKQAIRQSMAELLKTARELPADACVNEIRKGLSAIRSNCQKIGKTFIVVEERITCDRFDLGGSSQQRATLFRGPREDASVAICVTDAGSLLHRNGSAWTIYKNAGDVQLFGPTPELR